MRQLSLFLLLQFVVSCSYAQLTDNFSDGDYANAPAWLPGAVADWIVNSNGQLQSHSLAANHHFFISTASTMALETQWECWLRLSLNTSSANYADVYLTASAADLSLVSTSGYFVRIGNTQDEISLYRKDANGSITRLIDGMDGTTDKSDNVLKIKVIRNKTGQFTLLRDLSGTGNHYVSEGLVTDTTYQTSAYFGLLVRQSTTTFAQRHFFDDIEVKAYTPDRSPPAIVSVSAPTAVTADVLFSEAVEIASAQTPLNYAVNNGVGTALSAVRSGTDPALVHLTFPNAFGNGFIHTLTINGVKDLAENTLENGTASFSFYQPQTGDIVIDEIMADPAPQIGLPNAEFIELKNRSGHSVNLQGWRLATASSATGAFPAYTLPAGSFVVITAGTAAASLAPYGPVLGVPGFPSLPNEAGLLQLVSKEGKTIHAVRYSAEWYRNAVKAEGGWTLEMIDTENFCTGEGNWKGSINTNGGTPGQKNSVDAVGPDATPPQLLRTAVSDSLTVVAIFNETLDSASASVASKYVFGNGPAVTAAAAQAPLFNHVVLQLANPLQKGTVYTLTATGISDCSGNAIGAYNKAKAGRPSEVTGQDVIINEILFNPKSNGYDYVELYNRSQKIVDAVQLYLANRSNTGAVASQRKLSDEPFYLYPGDYLVLTQDRTSLQQLYLVKNPGAVLTLPALPSYPDDKGTVVLLNTAGDSIDEVAYHKDWHFALISDPEGVALERVSPDAPSQEKSNWHSAASTAGYGTPGYQNSQYKLADAIRVSLAVSPPVFSPDNDGRDDFATIAYQVEEKGYVANVLIFDAGGRLVKNLVKNELLALKGVWKWDGLGEQRNKLPVGTYIVFTEIFNLEGKKKSFKNTITLARQLN